jgi:hypothetical protein
MRTSRVSQPQAIVFQWLKLVGMVGCWKAELRGTIGSGTHCIEEVDWYFALIFKSLCTYALRCNGTAS